MFPKSPLNRVKQFLLLAPTPLFLLMAVVSYTATPSVCSATAVIPEMTIMWLLMALAHTVPWIARWEATKHRYSYAQADISDKQQ